MNAHISLGKKYIINNLHVPPLQLFIFSIFMLNSIMKKVKIYVLIDPNTNSVKYVGKTEMTLEKRLYHHVWDLKRCTNKHKVNWINSLLKSGQYPEIELIEDVEFDEWKFWEKFWISQFRTWGFDLVNYCGSGEGYTSEWVKKLWIDENYRKFHTKRVQGEKNPFFGKKHSEKTKDILRKKCPHFGKDNYFYGKKRSKEFVEVVRLHQPNIKCVVRIDLQGNYIDEWVGIKYMCKQLNLDDSAVIRVMKGKQKQHKGFKFKYKN